MRTNTVKRTLLAGGVSLGTMVFEFSSTGIGRLAATAGAEFVVYDMEHTGWGTETVRKHRAVRPGAGSAVPLPGAGPRRGRHGADGADGRERRPGPADRAVGE